MRDRIECTAFQTRMSTKQDLLLCPSNFQAHQRCKLLQSVGAAGTPDRENFSVSVDGARPSRRHAGWGNGFVSSSKGLGGASLDFLTFREPRP
jgi:hypothetical protein